MRIWTDGKLDIVLASASPRRRELLAQVGIRPRIVPSTVVEVITTDVPEEAVKALSRQKAEDVAKAQKPGTLVIGADTVVAVDGQILGKPKNHQEAADMVRKLAGGSHQVYTGVTLVFCMENEWNVQTFAEKTEVSVYPMSEEEILYYAAGEEPMDKAGAYGIQGMFAAFVKGIDGDYNNVVGLPVGRVCQEIKAMCSRAAFKD